MQVTIEFTLEFDDIPAYTPALGSPYTLNYVLGNVLEWFDSPTDYADLDIYPFGTLEF